MATAKNAPAAPKTDVAVAASTAVVLASNDYGDYAGGGFENQDQSDYAIPFLGMLQGLSPQIQTPTPQTEHMRQGMIINSVTGEIFLSAVGVPFVPAYTDHMYMEWKPRTQGGGLVGRHTLDAEIVKHAKEKAGTDFGLLKTPEGNDLIETFNVYGIYLDGEGNPQQAVVSFSSTKIKPYKAWMTKAKTIQLQLTDGRRIGAPLFAHRYRLKTVPEKNNKGAFYNWSIGFDGENAVACRLAPSDEIFQAAVAIKKLMESGQGKAAYDSLEPHGTDEPDGNGAAGERTPGAKPVF